MCLPSITYPSEINRQRTFFSSLLSAISDSNVSLLMVECNEEQLTTALMFRDFGDFILLRSRLSRESLTRSRMSSGALEFFCSEVIDEMVPSSYTCASGDMLR